MWEYGIDTWMAQRRCGKCLSFCSISYVELMIESIVTIACVGYIITQKMKNESRTIFFAVKRVPTEKIMQICIKNHHQRGQSDTEPRDVIKALDQVNVGVPVTTITQN